MRNPRRGHEQTPPGAGIAAIVAAVVALAPPRTPAHASRSGSLSARCSPGLTIHLRVSAPLDRRLRAATTAAIPPQETRELQNRWDTVIAARADLQTLALAGLLAALTVA
jgi:hypothetical protein